MPSIEVERRIAADPTSAVLLLAAPVAAELWPGVAVEAAESGDHIRLTVEPPPGKPIEQPTTALVRALPPQRTPTAYVIQFSFCVPGLPSTDGELNLGLRGTGAPSAAMLLMSATVARSSSSSDDPAVTDAFVAMLEDSAEAFLDNLAAAAENRSRAA